MIVLEEAISLLGERLARKRQGFGRGRTLVYSMPTDAFSPWLGRRSGCAQGP
jgi:hypothetical protein